MQLSFNTYKDSWDYSGEVWSVVGAITVPLVIPFLGTIIPVGNAPIEIKVMMGKDNNHQPHWYSTQAKTNSDGTFSGSFWLCDDPRYSNHDAYFTAYLVLISDHTVPGTRQGPFAEPVDSSPAWEFMLNACPEKSQPHFTDMHVASNPNYNITYSGKLIDEHSLPIKGANIYFTANYRDNKPGHGHGFNCLPDKNPRCIQQGVTSTEPAGSGYLTKRSTTKADGTFSGSFAACDLSIYVKPGSGYSSEAQLTAKFNGGTTDGPQDYYPATGVSDTFTTTQCSK
jgi:hypothetical protein